MTPSDRAIGTARVLLLQKFTPHDLARIIWSLDDPEFRTDLCERLGGDEEAAVILQALADIAKEFAETQGLQ